ncbi:MAG: FAD binding domain-containing protein [Acidimicrobiales bacterium]
MKPAPFDYVAARSVDHAVELLGSDADAKIIAGGQSLLPVLNMRLAAPILVVDIGRVDELATIRIDDEGSLVVGAAITQTDALADRSVADGWPMLHTAITNIGHPQIRNRGTVCGSFAHADPAAELPAVALALDASFLVRSASGERTIPAGDMFVGPFMTALEPEDLLVAAAFPMKAADTGWAFREFATRPGDFATVGVAVRLTTSDGVAADPRVAVFGVGGAATRLPTVEQALVGTANPAIDADVGTALNGAIDPVDDVHASADTRLELTRRLLIDAVAEAWRRCS